MVRLETLSVSFRSPNSHNPIEPLLAETNIPVLEDIVATERSILTEVYNGTNVTTIPQMWCLCKVHRFVV